MRHFALLALVVAAPGAVACSSSPARLADNSDAAAAPLDAGVDGPAPCSEPPSMRPEGGTCVLEATGTVTDLANAPLPDLVMTMCSPSVCFGSRADDAG